jgi:hypothetical protein
MDTLELANRVVSTVPPRRIVSARLRVLARKSEGDHPETHVHEHLRDAAAALDSGNTQAAMRHLGGAAHTLTPLSLMRHGISDDDGHALAKQNMGAIDRAILLIKQVQDTEAQNDAIQQAKAQQALADAQKAADRKAVATGVLPGPNPLGAGPVAGQQGSVQDTSPSQATSGVDPSPSAPPAAAPAAKPAAPPAGSRPAAAPAQASKPVVSGKPPTRPAAKASASRAAPAVTRAVGMAQQRRAIELGFHFNPNIPENPLTGAAGHRSGSFSQRRAAIELVGPKGYIHGWIFEGRPGSNEHVNALSDLGGKMAARSPVAALSMRHAADRVALGQYKLAAGHIRNAQFFARRQAPEFNDDLSAAAGSLAGLHENPLATTSPATRTVTGRPRAALLNPAPSDLGFSAETAGLTVTPAPYGKPGGPGLYGVAGQKHSDYFEHIVQAMKRRGKTDGEASAMAYGILRRWSRGGGKVHPEVQAAATAALAQEAAKHGGGGSSHAGSMAGILEAIELATAL